MLTATFTTPHEARVDLTTLSDADLLGEYSVFAGDFTESVTPGKERTNRYGRRDDAYAKQIRFQVWARAYDPAYRAALAHPSIQSADDAQLAADTAMGTILDARTIDGVWASCNRGQRLEDIAANLATQRPTLRIVHEGTLMKEPGARTDLEEPAAPQTEEEKEKSRANRRIYALDPHEYGFGAARTVSGDGLSYDLTAVEDAIDQRFYGSLTENEAVIEWFIETVTTATNTKREDVLAWLHTTGLTNEVEEYIDLVAATGSHEEAERLADQRRFPMKHIAAILDTSIATAERRVKAARDATYSDCTLTGALRSGLGSVEVNTETLTFALTTSLKAHAKQSGQTLTKALVNAVPDAFFADYIAEYVADGSTAADIDPALVAEMRAAVEEVAA